MIRRSRQSGALGTRLLRRSSFNRLHISLSLLYISTMVLVWVIVIIALNVSGEFLVRKILDGGLLIPEVRFVSQEVKEAAISSVAEGLFTASIVMLVIISVISAVFGYLLAGVVLKPVYDTLSGHKRFIADAAHELRTPLSIIKASSEATLLDKENLSDKDLMECVASNVEETNRMAGIIDSLLSISRFDDPRVKIPFLKIDLAGPLMRALEILGRDAKSSHVVLNVGKIDSVFVMGNEAALEELILNIIKNACEHTPLGGTISVSLACDPSGRYAYINVTDTGEGIRPADMPYIFKPFYKTFKIKNSQGMRGGQHYGLGLTLADEIAKRHNGKILVESSVGRGTTVNVRFPVRR